ncbi:MAG: hypothetical protein IJM84_01760 [Bacteroidaceae bacterium]|uniref:VCBS repeat-containing protein n=1 Tax=Pseudoprevotella muciniphila TaxID=2133944 RepID=A0A5P8E7Z5_9BACT|nr:hypothetical protein [Pseudoprevotella muciniphila]MBQ7056659.1 hypothetical protein [Bacteroidaceae bacterium]MBQ7664493.1 hypothetical protein [Bacteroidaceae bacterium]QFQ13058.1 hypothetical protein C7Y71_008505 [Pseudoprevotella muciniphila]
MRTVCHRLLVIGIWLVATTAFGQEFSLEQKNDTLSFLTLKTDSTCDRWELPYPVYQFCTGDVDGNGSTDAMVGVVKSTRYYKEKGRRIFIFKNYNGYVRPLWMGSKLGGILEDFRFKDGLIRSLETTKDGKYVVAEYRWAHFGMGFERFLIKNVTREEAISIFYQD